MQNERSQNAEGQKNIMSIFFAVPRELMQDTFLRQFDGVCHDTKGAHVLMGVVRMGALSHDSRSRCFHFRFF